MNQSGHDVLACIKDGVIEKRDPIIVILSVLLGGLVAIAVAFHIIGRHTA